MSFFAINSPSCIKSSANVLPYILSLNFSITFPESTKSETIIPSAVPQSSELIITSCEISTSLLVRYPESAVLNAVSANPFLAPCDDIKNSSILRPSLKFAFIGTSIILPCVSDINPLIPPSCLICAIDPLAPEFAIIYTGLNSSRLSIISLVTLSTASDQIATVLLYLSSSIKIPCLYCSSTAVTSFSAFSNIGFLDSGISKSSIPTVIPAKVP